MARETFGYSISIGEEEHTARVAGTYWPGHRGNVIEPAEEPIFDVATVEIPVAIRDQFGKPTGEFRHIDIVDALTIAQVADIAEHGVMAHDGRVEDAADHRARLRTEDRARETV